MQCTQNDIGNVIDIYNCWHKFNLKFSIRLQYTAKKTVLRLHIRYGTYNQKEMYLEPTKKITRTVVAMFPRLMIK